MADHILFTFRAAYPRLPAGGIYLIEDVQFHAGPFSAQWLGAATEGPQNYFLRLANRVVCPQERVECDADLAHATEAVEFAYGSIVVRKRPRLEADGIATRRAVVERAGLPHLWSSLASYILANGGDPVEAVACARRAVEAGSGSLGAHHMLSVALERAGDLPAAIAAMHEAVAQHPRVEMFAARLRELESR